MRASRIHHDLAHVGGDNGFLLVPGDIPAGAVLHAVEVRVDRTWSLEARLGLRVEQVAEQGAKLAGGEGAAQILIAAVGELVIDGHHPVAFSALIIGQPRSNDIPGPPIALPFRSTMRLVTCTQMKLGRLSVYWRAFLRTSSSKRVCCRGLSGGGFGPTMGAGAGRAPPPRRLNSLSALSSLQEQFVLADRWLCALLLRRQGLGRSLGYHR